VGVVLIPGLNVESEGGYFTVSSDSWTKLGLCHRSGKLTRKQRQDSLPALSEVHSRREQQHLEGCVDSIDSMVKQLAQGAALVCPACLASIHGVESLVEEETDGPAEVYPRRAVLIQSRRVPKQGDEVEDDETESRERDLFMSRQFCQ
jgi:hypothetical protein